MVACVCVRVCGRVWPCVRLQAVGGGLVELSKPDMVAGVRVKVKAALFGHALTSCTRTVHFTLAQPLMGCGDQPLLSNLTRDERAEQDPSGDELCVARLAGSAHTQRVLTVHAHVMFRLPRTGADISSIFGADAPSLRRYGMCRSSKRRSTCGVILHPWCGWCAWLPQALKATLANADGMVVVSNSAPVVRMPGDAALKTNVAAAMAAQHDGMMLAGAAMVGPVEGRFLMDDVEGCQCVAACVAVWPCVCVRVCALVLTVSCDPGLTVRRSCPYCRSLTTAWKQTMEADCWCGMGR